ncbi:Tetratricopeptide repeat-containing protein [Micromonospora inositola]|uniref:Tetratricopeptide repeat-containing protein n=1 Tax=Micromonospora inositola TaxID=47865 RepID=A0A1C5GUL2_9ACTN|nr:tetratricopeptide repeat protein [Micromonospora inositola]SCG37455.1 Tetratricopeptide repeat-containing protein [Micromonospora inositola]
MGRWADAAAELTAVLQVRPYDVDALCLLARCHDLAGDGPGMLDATDRALAVEPDHEWALRLRARALLKVKRRRAATAAARAAVAVAPHEWRTHAMLAEVLVQRMGVWSSVRARLSADTVLRLAPEEAGPHVVDAQVCLRTGEFDAARRACQRALAREPGNQAALHNLAVAELASERVGSAVRGFTAALAVAPDDHLTGTAHGRSARALLWRLFDVLAAATVVHAVLFGVTGDALGPWRRVLALATSALVMVGFGWLCRRAWRAQPAAVRWRLRVERRQAAVALWPILVLAAAVGLIVGAYRPAPDSFADQLRALALAVALGTFAVRCRNLLARGARNTLVRLGHRTGLAVHRAWTRARSRPGGPVGAPADERASHRVQG